MILEPWPFAIVPDPTRATIWVGRPDKERRIESLLASWRRRRASEIGVLWADFGQGKTHTLLHLAALAQADGAQDLVHYVQLPPLTSGSPFVALYRQLVLDFPLDELAAAIFSKFKNDPNDLFRVGRASERAIQQLLWLVATHGSGRDAALRWLRAERLSSSMMASLAIGGRRIEVGQAPNSAQDCQNVLDELLHIALGRTPGCQVVLLIDEFQRIGELTHRKRVEVCDSLHLIFNRHPQGLRMMLAFAGGLPEVIEHVLTPDLQSRVLTRLDLPPLSVSDAETYLEQLVSAYCRVGPTSPAFPFEPDAVSLLVRLADPTGSSLSPRKINVTGDLISNEVLVQRELNGVEMDRPITSQEIRACAPNLQSELQARLSVTE